MPTFYFGIEKEADIYCSSSKIGLSSDPQANNVIRQLKDVFLHDRKVNLPMDKISDFIVLLCDDNVLGQIDDHEDEKGVAWTIALLSKAYIAASTIPCSYDSLFKQCFIKYYKRNYTDGTGIDADTRARDLNAEAILELHPERRGGYEQLPKDAVEEIELTLDMVYYYGVAVPKQRLNTVDFLKAAYPILNKITSEGRYSRRALSQVMVNYFNEKLNPKQGSHWVIMLADSMARYRTFDELQNVMHIPEY